MTEPAVQDFYPDNYAVCYGCGRLNPHGLQIKSYWENGVSVCTFTPKSYHTAVPGYVYGGLLASLIDCHATGTAAAAMYRLENRGMDSEPPFRFVTGNLNVKYLLPTPIEEELTLRAMIRKIDGRKVDVHVEVYAGAALTVVGDVLVFQMPDRLIRQLEEDF